MQDMNSLSVVLPTEDEAVEAISFFSALVHLLPLFDHPMLHRAPDMEFCKTIFEIALEQVSWLFLIFAYAAE